MDTEIRIEIVNSNDRQWFDFVSHHPDAHVFHHPLWMECIAKCYQYHPMVAVMLDGKDEIRVGLPMIEIRGLFNGRRWIALPFTDHCAPLGLESADIPTFLALLQQETDRMGIREMEIRSNLPSSILYPSVEFIHTVLPLGPNVAEVAKQIKSNDLRKLRAAERHGIIVERGTSTHHMDVFYQLHLDTRHRHGLPIQPRKFFKLLQEMILEPGFGFVLLARQGDTYVSGAILLHWNKTLVYKFAASNQLGRQTYASDPVIWDAIRWGCENGFNSLDWGRTDPSDEGLRRFKMRWGSQENTLTYHNNHPAEPSTFREKFSPIMQKIITHSPRLVSRLTGEVFYKFFG